MSTSSSSSSSRKKTKLETGNLNKDIADPWKKWDEIKKQCHSGAILKDYQALVCFLTVTLIQEKKAENQNAIHTRAHSDYQKLAHNSINFQGEPFGSESFKLAFEAFVLPEITKIREEFVTFSYGAMMSSTHPKEVAVFKTKSGRTIWATGKRVQAHLRQYESIWKELLLGGNLASGDNCESHLEKVRLEALSRAGKFEEDGSKTIKDDEDLDSEVADEVEEVIVGETGKDEGNDDEESQLGAEECQVHRKKKFPKFWLAFLMFGSYAQFKFGSEPFPFVTDDAVIQIESSSSRSEQKAQAAGKRKKKEDPSTAVHEMVQVMKQRMEKSGVKLRIQVLTDQLNRLERRIPMITDERVKTELFAEMAKKEREIDALSELGFKEHVQTPPPPPVSDEEEEIQKETERIKKVQAEEEKRRKETKKLEDASKKLEKQRLTLEKKQKELEAKKAKATSTPKY